MDKSLNDLGFHCKGNLYFKRLGNGVVRMIKLANSMPSAPVVTCVSIDPDSWASIVAFVSAFGETHETFNNVLAFHQGSSEGLPLRKEAPIAI